MDVKRVMEHLDVDKPGIKIMQRKSEVWLFFIEDIHVGAANILKQDALSVGADFAVPKGVITCQQKRVDGLLMGTIKQLYQLVHKEKIQPYGLKALAQELGLHLRHKERFPLRIMGIINANDDSFYPQSRFKGEKAVAVIERMIQEGADIIDIGGMSTRPGSEEIDEDEELARVKEIINTIYSEKLYEKIHFSIDTYRPKVAAYALSHGFSILNDITGLENDEIARIAAVHGAKVVIMHKKGSPKTMQQNPWYEDVIEEVSQFFQERIEKAHKFGIKSVVLDPGIGFGKRVEDNLALIRDLAHFKRFGYEILVGASRKSMIDKISPSPVEKRLGGTLALHLKAIEHGASIIRCHDVAEHVQAVKIYEAMRMLV